jgi:hypothetical protein
MANISMKKVDSLPEISRVGRQSEELRMIIDALKESAKSNAPFRLDGIKAGNSYNSMQQRIRAQAKNLNLKVVVRYDAKNEALYFQASNSGNVKPVVKTDATSESQVKSKK